MTPITKNGSETIRVFDVHGNELEPTFPKRAKGLVKKGRAQWLGSVNHDDPDFVPDSIILCELSDELTDPAERTAEIQHQTEVPSMLFFNTNNEPDNTNEIPAEEPETGEAPQTEIDPAIRKMIDDFKASIAKARSEAECAIHQIEETVESSGMKEDAESLFRKTKSAIKDAYHRAAAAINVKKEEAAAGFDVMMDEEADIISEESDNFTETLRRMTADDAGIEIPEDGDMQALLHHALELMQEIPGNSTFTDDPEIAAIEADKMRIQCETVQEMYRQTLEIMSDRRREAAEQAEREQKQLYQRDRILSLEEDKEMRMRIVDKLYQEGKITLDEYMEQMNNTITFFNAEIYKVITMM